VTVKSSEGRRWIEEPEHTGDGVGGPPATSVALELLVAVRSWCRHGE
jgi:hypothetical protein